MQGFLRGGTVALEFLRDEMIHINGIGQKTIDKIYNGLHQRMIDARGKDNVGSADPVEVER